MQDRLPKREEVSKDLTWRLEDIYDDEAKWEEDLNKLSEVSDKIASYAGKLGNGAKVLLELMDQLEVLDLLISRIHGYAHMREDQDTGNSKYQAMKQRAMSGYTNAMEKAAYINPEIIALSDEQLDAYYKEESGLEKYRITINDTRRLKDHMLNAEMEQLLASAVELQGAAQKSYGMLSNADLKFPSVKDSEGKEVQLSNGRFVPTQMSKDRQLRKDSFEAFYGRYEEFKNTWAAMYDGELKGRIFEAKARKYNLRQQLITTTFHQRFVTACLSLSMTIWTRCTDM